MPPLEGMKCLISLFVTWNRKAPEDIEAALRKKGRKSGRFKLGVYDISRAQFYGAAKRRVFVKPPPEMGYPEGTCGLLLKSWYGTQDASAIWQAGYSELLKENQFTTGLANAAVF